MNLALVFLMGSPQQGGDGGMISLLFMAAIFAVFYFFIIRPQSKRQKEIQQKIASIKKGDKVVTNGGIIGIVNSIEDDSLLVEIDNNVKVRFLKNSVTDVNPQKKVKK
ncbi:MAG TPA: preprotein translocase subunit YajC [Balneolales bacterium]|nr:preprotein translocase subunit YajC [Balneolales bacterium]